MEIVSTLFPLLAPVALGGVALTALRQPGAHPRAVLQAASFASAVGGIVAVATAARVLLAGPATSPVLGLAGVGLALRLDALSAVMLGLVAFMGWVVLRYSRNYLGGDPKHGAFLGGLSLTVGSVMLLVLSGNLAHLVFFWGLTSFFLHRLLLFYSERRGAVIAARKKFLVARAGDLALAGAAVLLFLVFGTADLSTILERAAEAGSLGDPRLGVGALLVALSAALKSAQFPTHGWLADVMETPTPVSALLHAGIINGGTFLVARLGEVMLLAPVALNTLIVVGGVTALFGSVVMVTQTSVKASLAYSSAAHMGFMLFLCGLGAFPVAILHLVAHSFYKAHAFLASGSAVEALPMRTRSAVGAPGVVTILAGMILSLGTVVGISTLLGISIGERPVAVGLASILVIGLTQLWTRGIQEGGSNLPVVGRLILQASGVTLAFFGLEAAAAWILAGAVPAEVVPQPPGLSLMVGVIVAFAAVVVLQLRLPALEKTPLWTRLRVHVRNGFYADALFNRVVGALRVPSTTTFHRSQG